MMHDMIIWKKRTNNNHNKIMITWRRYGKKARKRERKKETRKGRSEKSEEKKN